MKIGEVTAELGISVDTLRYYEKIHLLPNIKRSAAGQREYTAADIARVRFIKRAQKMGFSLDDIASLLAFRDAPAQSKPMVRNMVAEKLTEINHQLQELSALRDELMALTAACEITEDNCPILDKFNKK